MTEILKQIIQQNITKQHDEVLNKHLNNLSEDIHWILLITGFILFEINSDVEQANIPEELMKYSINCSSHVDMNLINKMVLTLNQFDTVALSQNASKSSFLNSIGLLLIDTKLSDSEPCDPISRLIYHAFQLCEIEMHMFTLNMLQYLSPQVASSLMWFLKEFSRSYLFMKESNYNDISPVMHTVFGQDTQYGLIILNYILRKLLANFYIWSAENATTSQTARVLLELVKHKEMSKVLFSNEQFWSISKVVTVNEMPWLMLPSSVKKIVIKSLVISCGIQNYENNLMQEYFCLNILKPLSDRFETLSLVKSGLIHTESCIKEVMSLIETLNGIIEGASKNIIKELLPFVLPRLQQGVHLLDVYHNYGEIVELILCMFNGVIEKFIVQLNDWPDAKNQIFECFLHLIQIFSKHNSGFSKLHSFFI